MKRYLLPLLLLLLSIQSYGQYGFSTTAVNWNLPSGGKVLSSHNYSFNDMFYAGTYDTGNQSWATMDINGDKKADLVIYAQGDGTYRDCFGAGSSPYWKVYLNTGAGFSASPINWTLPAGGKVLSGHNYSFNDIAYAGTYDAGNQSWSTMDINGDGKVDLVVCAQGDGTYRDCFGIGSSPHWMVYLNTGTGFSTTASNWSLPAGGKTLSSHFYSFNDISYAGTYDAGNQSWTTMDINGDSKVDLVVHAQGDGTYRDCFGAGASAYWKVYLNTGTGFSSTYTSWNLPSGGKVLSSHNYSFNDISYTGTYDLGNQSWTTMDINGDKKPDLVIHAEGDGTYRNCYGVGASPYWKVYLNNGAGFAASYTNWSLPAGGKVLSSHNYSFNDITYAGTYDAGNQGWTTMDINGDGLADLVINSQGDGTYRNCFGTGTNTYWNVYLNSGTGFATTSVHWTLPAGGKVLSGHSYSFNDIAYAGTYDITNQSWTTMDINGDGKVDLIVHAEGDGTYRDCFGIATGPYWKVYLNTATLSAVTELEGSNAHRLYPNPFSDAVTIELNEQETLTRHCIVTNVNGQIVYDRELYSNQETLYPALTPGIYFYSITNPDGHEVARGKMIRQD